MNCLLMRHVAIWAFALAGVTQNLCGTSYTITDLGLGVAKDVNRSGKIVGNAASGGWYSDGATRTTLKFGARFLGTPLDQQLFFTAAAANAINDSGRIAGSVIFIPLQLNTQTAFYFDGGDGAILLSQGDALGINSAGFIVGGAAPAFIFDAGGVRSSAEPSAKFNAVNDSGVAVGSVAPHGLDVAASFSATGFAVLDLDGLALPTAGLGRAYQSTALSINNAGTMVGQVRLQAGPVQLQAWAFLAAQGAATSLGSLGGLSATARDINQDGLIVGSATVADESSHAFVYANGTMADLNSLVVGAFGWVLNSANAVNDDGWIVGEGRKDGVQRAFLLKPAANTLPPSISLEPVSTNIFADGSFSLSVNAAGTGPLSYQWRHASTNLPGATASTYSVAHATATHAGSYQVVVTNPFGSTQSKVVSVQVNAKVTGTAELALALYAGISVVGPVGLNVRIEAVENAGETNWQPLTTLVLGANASFWVDPATPQHPHRVYRAVPLP